MDVKGRVTAMTAAANRREIKPGDTAKTERVWVEMSAVFGRLWESQFGEIGGNTFKVWAKIIEHIEPEKLRAAVNTTLKEAQSQERSGSTAYPPSLPRFLAYSNPIVRADLQRVNFDEPSADRVTPEKIREFGRLLALRKAGENE